MKKDEGTALYLRAQEAIVRHTLTVKHIEGRPRDAREYFYERCWILELGDEGALHMVTHSEYAEESSEKMRRLLKEKIFELKTSPRRSADEFLSKIEASAIRIAAVLGIGSDNNGVVTLWHHPDITAEEAAALLHDSAVTVLYELN